MICPKAKYSLKHSILDIEFCLECLKLGEKCFHDKPRFNTVKIKTLLEKENSDRYLNATLKIFIEDNTNQ